MADKEDLIGQFKAITNQDDDRARFYLESANWNLDLAMSSFYDNAPDTEMMDAQPIFEPPPASDPDPEFVDAQEDVTNPHDEKSKDPQAKSSSSGSRFHSLADYEQAFGGKGDDSDEEGQEFYAGGSENSGEVIIGPGKKKSGEDIVKSMFKSAKKHGAMEVDPSASSSHQKKGPTYFTGGGYKLGEKEDDHQFIPGAEKPIEQRKLDIVLKLWKEGFTVGDGPLRPYHDEESKKFLGAVAKGEIPQELLRLAKGGEVNLDMEDHKNEDYKPEKKKMKAFTGEGHMLGSAVPTVVSSESPAPKPKETSSVDPKVIIDESSPVTTVRVQMGDGTRITQKFNHYHTVAQIYAFVRDCNPGNTRNFILMTTFPNKELKEDSTTLKEGKLLNAVIVQRFK